MGEAEAPSLDRLGIGMGKVTVPFNDVKELEELLSKISGGTLTIEFETREEFCEIVKMLLRYNLQEVKLVVSFRPRAVAEVRQQQSELPGTSSDLKNLRCKSVEEIDEEKVYEVVKAIVESRIREGRPYFMMQDVYIAICGRTLHTYRDKDDYKVAVRLTRTVKRWLPRIGKELRVRFEEDVITQYGGRTGKFKVFRILPENASTTAKGN